MVQTCYSLALIGDFDPVYFIYSGTLQIPGSSCFLYLYEYEMDSQDPESVCLRDVLQICQGCKALVIVRRTDWDTRLAYLGTKYVNPTT